MNCLESERPVMGGDQAKAGHWPTGHRRRDSIAGWEGGGFFDVQSPSHPEGL